MPVSYNKCPNEIYMKFNTTNTLTKASWIFKGIWRQIVAASGVITKQTNSAANCHTICF